MIKYVAGFLKGLNTFLMSIIDTRVSVMMALGLGCFFITQDIAMITSLISTLGLVFVSLSFGTLVRKIMINRLDLSMAVEIAQDSPIGAAIVVASVMFLVVSAMFLVAMFINA